MSDDAPHAPAPKFVYVRTEDGEIKRGPASQLQAALDSGAEQVSEEDAAQHALQQKYGGFGQQARTAVEAGLSGATLGLSDAAAAGLGGDDLAHDMANRRKANPITNVVGQVGGALAPIIASGGTAAPEVAAIEGAGDVARAGMAGAEAVEAGGAIARVGQGVRAVGAPVRLADAAGGIAEHAAKAVFGDAAEGAFARAAQKGLAGAARGATEGALFGAGNEISETSLGDHQLTGESLMAAIGHGALFGGLAGGAMGAGGSLALSGGKGLAAKLSPQLREVAEGQAWKAIVTGGNMAKVTRQADKLPGGVKSVQRWLLDEGIVKAGDSVQDIAPRISALKDEAGDKLSSLLVQAEQSGAKFDRMAAVGRINREVTDELMKSPSLNAGVLSAVDKAGEDFGVAASKEGTIQAMHDFRKQIDSHIDWNKAAASRSPTESAFVKIRSILEDEIDKAGDKAASTMGKSWGEEYRATKLDFRRATVADAAAKESVQAAVRNNALGLRASAMGGAGMAAAVMSGHPLALVGAVATTAAAKLAQDRGAATAASVLDKIADLAAVRKIAGKVEGQTTKAMDAFVAGDRKALPYRSSASAQPDYAKAVKEVRAAAASPDGTANAMSRHLQTISQTAPKVADAFRMSAVRASTYLAGKVPRDGGVGTTMQPQFSRQEPSDQAKAEFLKAYGAIDDPVSVIHDMHAGKLTHGQVDAIKSVYPALFARMQTAAVSAVASKKSKLDYNQTIQLGILLGVPTDPSLNPQTVQLLQSSYSGSSSTPPGPPKTPTAPKRMLKGMGDAGTLQTRGKL